MDLALPALADAEDLAVRVGAAASDPLIELCLQQISARFRGATGNDITAVDDTLTLDGTGTAVLALPVRPVINLVSVTEDGTLLDPSAYQCSTRNGLLRKTLGLWTDRYDAIEVRLRHGYARVPDEIADIVLDEAAILYAIQPGLSSITVGAETTAFAVARSTGAAGMSEAWAALVAVYKIDRGRA